MPSTSLLRVAQWRNRSARILLLLIAPFLVVTVRGRSIRTGAWSLAPAKPCSSWMCKTRFRAALDSARRQHRLRYLSGYVQWHTVEGRPL
eukprot:scaffold22619_cov149-Isochrysis_galbana.AAC.1